MWFLMCLARRFDSGSAATSPYVREDKVNEDLQLEVVEGLSSNNTHLGDQGWICGHGYRPASTGLLVSVVSSGRR